MEIFTTWAILAILFITVAVGIGLLAGKKGRRFALFVLLCVPVVAGLVYFRAEVNNHHTFVSVAEHNRLQSEQLVEQRETETARQTAIRTRIELLEKELEAELEAKSEPETDQKSKKPKLSPGDAAVAEKAEKEATNKQIKKTKQLLEEAKQELQKEKEKPHHKPHWLTEYPTIEKKNWLKHLAHPETIPSRFIISSGRFTTIQEAQSDANRLAKVTISAKLKAITGQQGVHYDEAWYQSTLSRTYDEATQVKILNGSPTTMHREHLLVDINRDKLSLLMPDLRKAIVEKRIYTAAGGIVGIMLMSGLLSVVLSRGKK